jgi:hypothetical protein
MGTMTWEEMMFPFFSVVVDKSVDLWKVIKVEGPAPNGAYVAPAGVHVRCASTDDLIRALNVGPRICAPDSRRGGIRQTCIPRGCVAPLKCA